MSSLQIAEITGKEHANVMRDIRTVLEQAEIVAIKFEGYYIASNGKQNPCFNLPRRECDLVISGYSVKYRLAIIDRWHELEKNQGTTIPQDYPSALQAFGEKVLLAAEQARQLQLQEFQLHQTFLAIHNAESRNSSHMAKLEQQAPKVTFFDTVIEAGGLMGMAAVAKMTYPTLGHGEHSLYQALRVLGVLCIHKSQYNLPYQKYINQKLFEVKETVYTHPRTGELKVRKTTMVTQKGIARILKKVKPYKAI